MRIYKMKSFDFIDAFNLKAKVALQLIKGSSAIAIACF